MFGRRTRGQRNPSKIMVEVMNDGIWDEEGRK